jgi:hypothetical protein
MKILAEIKYNKLLSDSQFEELFFEFAFLSILAGFVVAIEDLQNLD